MMISGRSPAEVISAVELSFKKVLPLLTEEERAGRTGAYFTVVEAGKSYSPVALTSMIFIVPEHKVQKYFSFSIEKAQRLALKMRTTKHMSSLESRDEAADEYGGSVYVLDGLIFSLSGLTEMADEAVVLYAAFSLYGDRCAQRVYEIARKNSNTLFFRMLSAQAA